VNLDDRADSLSSSGDDETLPNEKPMSRFRRDRFADGVDTQSCSGRLVTANAGVRRLSHVYH
jgi:hypothetical protein